MKKTLALMLAFAATALVALAAPKRIEVADTDELIDNLGSNRTLVLTGEYYHISDALLSDKYAGLEVPYTEENTTKNIYYVMDFDGPELHIANFENLTIEAGLDVVTIVTDPRYVNVFVFENCRNVTLKGLTIGHTEEGYCDNGVLGFRGCSGFKLIDCDLYGCGTEGICVANCSSMYFEGIKIRDCSYHIMHLISSQGITFEGCQFFRNREFELVNVYDCEEVLFRNCMFANNTGNLFNLQSPVTLKDCVILHDGMFFGEGDQINWINTIFEEYFGSEQALG